MENEIIKLEYNGKIQFNKEDKGVIINKLFNKYEVTLYNFEKGIIEKIKSFAEKEMAIEWAKKQLL